MSLRDAMNRNPGRTAAVVGVMVVICIGVAVWQVMGGGPPGGGSAGGDQAFYTTDAGKTWFPAEADKLPPFDHQGKTALRVYIFQCGEDGKPFANHLERVNPAVHKRVTDLKAKGATTELESILFGALEVQRPGEGKWLPASSNAGMAVTIPKCPGGEGGSGTPVPVSP